jgi:ring-1,2-phenylacetyl-CoA epoxidase subunit PaaD
MDDVSTIWSLLETVNDPEIPVLSVVDLGIIRDVRLTDDGPEIVITPTYSGCPAMDMIRADIGSTLSRHGLEGARIVTVLSPAWTTDWMSEAGKDKLRAYGIAPPQPLQQACRLELFRQAEAIACPRCHSYQTTLISEFGSTACKALYRCEECREPFDHFKCH